MNADKLHIGEAKETYDLILYNKKNKKMSFCKLDECVQIVTMN